MKNLRKRFVFFNMLVISSIAVIIGLFMFLGSPRNEMPAHRYIPMMLLVIFAVYLGSLILSKVAIRPIQASWQKQLDFTADASHELRTPITVIQTNLDLVMDSPDETVKSQMKWLKNIEAENQRMAKLVEDLLILSRADTDQQMLEKELFMLDEAISETLLPFEPMAREKHIELDIVVHNQIAFYGDRKRIKQLVVILLDNALNYTDSGTITMALAKSDKEITITVSDTGHGIEAEHLGKIFDRFYRVTKTKTLNQDGSGLGLAIAKWIVQEHGGRMQVTSTPGTGTSFTAHLPNPEGAV